VRCVFACVLFVMSLLGTPLLSSQPAFFYHLPDYYMKPLPYCALYNTIRHAGLPDTAGSLDQMLNTKCNHEVRHYYCRTITMFIHSHKKIKKGLIAISRSRNQEIMTQPSSEDSERRRRPAGERSIRDHKHRGSLVWSP
jgi:hypothetical protein